MIGTLYVVGTPIGNLKDISIRALEVLGSVDTIFCEDTRVTRKLLQHYDIKKKCVPYHSFSGSTKIRQASRILHDGKDIALVSDAGTPSISDPGVKFVREIRDKFNGEISIVSIPGPSALTAALSISGAPASSFVFLGFLPRKKGRSTAFNLIAQEKRTVVLYEAPHRLLKTLLSLEESIDTNREVIVVKEMTKIYETVVSGTAKDVHTYFKENEASVRGEFVVIISSLHLN